MTGNNGGGYLDIQCNLCGNCITVEGFEIEFPGGIAIGFNFESEEMPEEWSYDNDQVICPDCSFNHFIGGTS